MAKQVVHAACPRDCPDACGWAKLGAGFRNLNLLTSEILSDLGNSATFYSVLVEVESAKSFP
jgi:hypothetical protein